PSCQRQPAHRQGRDRPRNRDGPLPWHPCERRTRSPNYPDRLIPLPDYSMASAEERTVRSFCRLCSAFCGILVDASGDEVLRVRGDPDHPLSRGYTCAKGRALPRLHHHPGRLERPLMRVDGVLQPTSWEVCLDDIGHRLAYTIDRYGPESVGVYF